MDYLIIEVPDENDSMSSVVLAETYYKVRFTYNDTMDYWSFGLYDDSGDPIVIGMKIVPGMVLNLFFGENLTPGAFGVITELEHIGRDDFVDGNAQFVFVPVESESTES